MAKKEKKPKLLEIESKFTAHKYQEELYTGWKRFNLAITCRGWGKTVAAVMALHHAAVNATKPTDFAYIAPVKGQVWDLIGPIVLEFLGHLEVIEVGGGKRIKGPLTIKHSDKEIHYSNGCKIKAYGADYPNNKVIRGKTFGGVVVDETDDIDLGVWLEIIAPCMRGGSPWALLVGTVKPGSNLYTLKDQYEDDPNWQCKIYKFEDCWEHLPAYWTDTSSGIPDQDKYEDIKSRAKLDGNKYLREYQCDPSAADDEVVIPTHYIYQAKGKHIPEEVCNGLVKVMGVDVATGFGSDKSAICKRHGLICMPINEYNVDNMTLADIVAREICEWEPDAVFVDKGRGEGVISRLRQMGYSVIGVDFGGTAIRNDIYGNRRVEMYFGIKDWLESGGAIPDDKELVNELATPCLKPGDGKFMMERKADIKKKLNRSPDKSDALALTFANKVAPKQNIHRQRNNVTNCSNYRAMQGVVNGAAGYRRSNNVQQRYR